MGVSGMYDGGASCSRTPPSSPVGNHAVRSEDGGPRQGMTTGLRSCPLRTQVRAPALVEWEATGKVVLKLSFNLLLLSLARHRILDPEGLALGAIIASSKKAKRDLIDDSFSR